jgi:hypothetical protein
VNKADNLTIAGQKRQRIQFFSTSCIVTYISIHTRNSLIRPCAWLTSRRCAEQGYACRAVLGCETDTGDATGEVLRTADTGMCAEDRATFWTFAPRTRHSLLAAEHCRAALRLLPQGMLPWRCCRRRCPRIQATSCRSHPCMPCHNTPDAGGLHYTAEPAWPNSPLPSVTRRSSTRASGCPTWRAQAS